MTSSTISYANLSPAKKKERALEDCKIWLGKNFKPVVAELKKNIENGTTIEQAANLLCFAGIRGYPATALAEYARDS